MADWFQQHAHLIGVLMMPVTYGFTGWFTNMLALKMTFYPLKFWGIPPFLGWQGIVPRKASGLALKSVNMLTEKLIRVDEFFKKLKPEMLKKQFIPVVEKNTPEITGHMLDALDDHLKSLIDDTNRKEIVDNAVMHARDKVNEIAGHLDEDIKKVFNFKALVLRNLTGPNVKLIVDIFQEVGAKEFTFIKRSGWYFGSLLGIIQMGLWQIYPEWYTLPIQGVIVGYVTNWLALTMIFRPLYEKSFAGIKYRGLFLKRQPEVSEKYATIFAEHVLSARNILEEILYRRIARSVVEQIENDIIQVLKTKEENSSLQVEVDKETEKVRKQATGQLNDMLAESSLTVEKMMQRSMNVKKMIFERMKDLPPEEFEPILRSAFQEDEYILIVLGAALGAVAGLLQGLYMISV